jgi:hypothetical protein
VNENNCGPDDVVQDRAVRAEYVREVASLADKAVMMLGFGLSDEFVARTVHAQRRVLSEQYKGLTTAAQRSELYRRNLAKYGDPQGPTVGYLRAEGKSWLDIIASASRPGSSVFEYIEGR